jgi:ADP-ribosylation factor GTPase-activating protein 1
MDKWKDIELEKMKAGGNRNAKAFLEAQDDWDDTLPIQQKYNSRAAALYRDKINTVAQGKVWDQDSAQARIKPVASVASFSSMTSQSSSMHHSRSSGALGGYQNGGGESGYQQFNTAEFKEQKENFFSRRQEENAKRSE